MFPKVAAPKMILTFFDMLRVVYTRQLRGQGKTESGELMKNVLWWTKCFIFRRLPRQEVPPEEVSVNIHTVRALAAWHYHVTAVCLRPVTVIIP
jgi:hypothetical protein